MTVPLIKLMHIFGIYKQKYLVNINKLPLLPHQKEITINFKNREKCQCIFYTNLTKCFFFTLYFYIYYTFEECFYTVKCLQ